MMWKNQGQPRGGKKGPVGKKNPDLFKMSLFGHKGYQRALKGEVTVWMSPGRGQCEAAGVGTMLCLGGRWIKAAWHMSPCSRAERDRDIKPGGGAGKAPAAIREMKRSKTRLMSQRAC